MARPRKIQENEVIEMEDKPKVRVLTLPLARQGSLTPDTRYGPPDAPWTQMQIQNRLSDYVSDGYKLLSVEFMGEDPEYFLIMYHLVLAE